MKEPVKFNEPWGNFNAGETAGFLPKVARTLVKQGIARPVDVDTVASDAAGADASRDAELDVRETELAQREQALQDKLAALEAGQASATAAPDANNTGAPPKQGGKK